MAKGKVVGHIGPEGRTKQKVKDTPKPKLDLDAYLKELDPQHVTDTVSAEHDNARLAYDMSTNRVKNYQQFIQQVADYVQHHHKLVYKSEMSEERAFGMAKAILDADKDNGGFMGHYRRARTGQDGGLKTVIDKLGTHFRMEGEHHYTQHVMHKHLDPDDHEGQVEFAKAYMERFESILPKGMKKKGAEQVIGEYGVEGLVTSHLKIVEQAKARLEKEKKGEYAEAA